MAAILCFVVSLAFVGQVFAADCSEFNTIKSCDECLRCGGSWCLDASVGPQCSYGSDTWCSMQEDYIKISEQKDQTVQPMFIEKTVWIGQRDEIEIDTKPGASPVTISLLNSTQTKEVDLTKNNKRGKGGIYSTTLTITPTVNFCKATGDTTEYMFVKIDANDKANDALIKYHVPCACACSKNVIRNSTKCNGVGDEICGACTCQAGWTGSSCDKRICETRRGDIQCSSSTESKDCSGNGYCSPCDTCICYEDRVGSQYFDSVNCADICSTVNDCDVCLDTPDLGPCSCSKTHQIHVMQANETVLQEKDSQNRKVWVECKGTTPDCPNVEYAAMRDSKKQTHIMVFKGCGASAATIVAGGGVNVTAAVVVTTVLLVAAAAAVAGYIMWFKQPPMPLSDSQYKNIGAEDCTGENPLYKPPMSSFKNPMYGKS